MKSLKDCEPCRQRLALVIVGFACLGLVLGTKEIYKTYKNLKNK